MTVPEKDAWGRTMGPVGSMTYRFNSPESARQAAIEKFHEKFAPGWVLVDDDENVVAET